MFKPVPVAIGLRYLRAKRRNGFISFISLASILGIALGVTVLITTMAVMSGFQKEIRDRLLQFAAHATVVADGVPMQDWRHALEIASGDPRVAGAAPFIETEALLSGPRKQPAMVRGVEPALERARESLDEVRRSVLDLRAGPLERQTIEAALEALGRRFADETGIVVTTHIDLAGLRLPARSEEALYRIAQEALANVRRHAQASTVEIGLRVADEHVRLTIGDDGNLLPDVPARSPERGRS